MRIIAALLASIVLAGSAFAGCVPQWTSPRTASWGYGGDFEPGDFNGDGITDLASVVNHRVTVLPITATGNGPATLVYTGDYLASRVLVYDVQGDGKLDLIASDISNNSIIFLPGNGDGTFGAPVASAVPFSPTRIVTGDFDNDGKVDVAFASYSAQLLVIAKGNGAGAFAEGAVMPLTTGVTVQAIGAGDFDADGVDDIVLTYVDSPFGDVYYGYPDGSLNFDQVSDAIYGTDIAIADLDEDGDADFVTADFDGDRMVAFRSNGNRTYTITTHDASDTGFNSPISITTGDVTNDDVLDVIMVAPNSRQIVTYEGLGNAAFGAATLARTLTSFSSSYFPVAIAAGNFNDDARTEIVVGDANRSFVAVYAHNNCGELAVDLSLANKVISVGQETELTVSLRTPGSWYALGYGDPTGTIKVFDGATEIASQGIASGNRGIRVLLSGLPEGVQALHAEYSGDEHYDPATSTPISLNVTSVVTNVTVAASIAGPYTYGQSFQILGNASASNGGTPTGEFRMTVNGVDAPYEQNGPPVQFPSYITGAGTFRYRIAYAGNDVFPPGISDELVIEVGKATAEFQSAWLENYISAPGSTRIYFRLAAEYNSIDPTGTVTLMEGNTVLGTDHLTSSGYVEFRPSLAAGRHALRLVYPGDGSFFPASVEFTHDVVANSFWLDTITVNNRIYLQWPYRGDADRYSVKRRVGDGWVEIANLWRGSTMTEHVGAQPGVAYVYRVDALDYNLQIIAQTNPALAMIVNFTDEALEGARVKAQHLRELVDATNAVRATASLQPYSQTVTAGAPIRAFDVTSLRAAIDQAMSVLALPPFAWSAAPAQGSPVRALHVRELRAAFR